MQEGSPPFCLWEGLRRRSTMPVGIMDPHPPHGAEILGRQRGTELCMLRGKQKPLRECTTLSARNSGRAGGPLYPEAL